MRHKIGTLAVVRAILKLSTRRSANRMGAWMRAGRRRSKTGRQATAPRRSGWKLLQGFFYLCFLLMAFSGASGLVAHLGDRWCHADQIALSRSTYRRLFDTHSHRWLSEDLRPNEPPDLDAIPEVTLRKLRQVFADDALRLRQDAGSSEEETLARLIDQYRARGPDGFYVEGQVVAPFPRRECWPGPEAQPALLTVLTVTVTALMMVLIAYGLSQFGRDLTAVHWSTEWFFNFPVPAGAIFLADVLQSSLLNLAAWGAAFPLLLAVLITSGYGLIAIPLAAAGTVYLAVLAGAVCMLAETWMRRHFSLGHLRSIQATSTALTMLAYVVLLIAASNPTVQAPLANTLSRAATWPHWLVWLPSGLPLMLVHSPWTTLAAMAGIAVGLTATACLVSGRLVRTGLVAGRSSDSGRPVAAQPRSVRPVRLHGVLGREVRLLLRDRTLLVNTVIMPVVLSLLMIAMQFHLLASAQGNVRHGAALAFGVACYMLLIGGSQIVASEGRSLWMLYTFPRPLHWVPLRKTILWACFAGAFAVAILAYAMGSAGGLSLGALGTCALALWGVGTFAFIHGGIAAMTFEPPQGGEKPRPKTEAALLSTMLAGMYAGALYAPSLWSQVVWAVLFALIAVATWQWVPDRIGYLLDRTATPTPKLSAAHGLIAAFAFFALQGIGAMGLVLTGMATAAAMTLSYVLAGAMVTLFTLVALFRVPNLLRLVGLRPAPPRFRALLSGVATGLLLGIAAGAAGAGWLLLCRHVPALRELAEQTRRLDLLGDNLIPLAILAILAAPVFEEFIFRGLLLRGLERSIPPAAAVPASAAIFAVIHPPIAVAPVFALGLAAASGFRRTGLLITPVVTHMVYNAIVLLAERGLLGA